MTRHGIIVTIVATSTTSIGVVFQWNEFLLLGLLIFVLLFTSAIYVAYAPPSVLSIREQLVSTTRTIPTSFLVEVDSRRKRGLLVQFARGPLLFRSIPVPNSHGIRTIRVQIDPNSRCDHELGSIHLFVSDIFGFFQKNIGICGSVQVVVEPRVFYVLSDDLSQNQRENNETHRTGQGSQLSELVTEYNLGDEHRRIHWKTSAKVGKLMVRKEFESERTDVMMCLDTEVNSYFSTSRFATAKEEYDFELFLELFTSLCVAEAKSGSSVQILTTGKEPSLNFRLETTSKFLRLMANVELTHSGIQGPEKLLKSARLYKPSKLVIVTASPGDLMLDVLSELQKYITVTIIGCNMTPDVRGLDLDARSIHLSTS